MKNKMTKVEGVLIQEDFTVEGGSRGKGNLTTDVNLFGKFHI